MFLVDPPVPAGLPRLAPAAGEFMEGYWIPANVGLAVEIPSRSPFTNTSDT